MLEKLLKTIGRKITTMGLAGSFLLSSGCVTYKTISPNLIQPVKPIEIAIERQIERPIDYSKLTWQEAIKYVQTPEQVQDYLDRHFIYEYEESSFIPGVVVIGEQKGETFKYNHTRRKGNCFDHATASAALLSDNNYPPLLLTLSGESENHSVFLYKIKEGYGVLGETSLDPKYHSVKDLLNGLKFQHGLSFDKFNIVNLDANYEDKEWVSGDMNLVKNISLP